jgi:hypothetical protein
MTASETDLDADKFIFGEGAYINLPTARPSADSNEFRIEPAPIPLDTIVAMNALFVVFFGALIAFLIAYSKESMLWRCYVPLGIGLTTSASFTGIVYYQFSTELRRGPMLIFDKRSERVRLPRLNLEFQREEVVHLQYITTKRLQFKGRIENDQLSELNIVTQLGEAKERWPLLRSLITHRAFDQVLQAVLRETDLPIVRVTDEWLGWSVTETPYEPKI